MSLVNFTTREITCKIVYYGPGRSGKTTNLQYIYGRVPEARRGRMVSLATQTDRTLFFDFLPLDLGVISGFTTRFQLYTVPGQVYYNATRKLVLQGADGVVFVADSQARRLDDNLESLQNLQANLLGQGVDALLGTRWRQPLAGNAAHDFRDLHDRHFALGTRSFRWQRRGLAGRQSPKP